MEIPKSPQLEKRLFSIDNEETFVSIAFEVYEFQYNTNIVYKSYCDLLGRSPSKVASLDQIPFLPISLFKTHEIKAGTFQPDITFSSSGTTGAQTSRHFVKNKQLYIQSFLNCFNEFFGPVEEYCILGLLPSYLERNNSSLVYMVKELIERSRHPQSGFYLYEAEKLSATIQQLETDSQKTLLFGVTFALLDLAYSQPCDLHHTRILETGGMKGRRKEMTRQELYGILKEAFKIDTIYSEYGMTELLSQGYGVNGIIRTPSWMTIRLRDETDPLTLLPLSSHSQTGGINVIDLANLYSCSFIATDDIGKLYPDGSFEILGRLDHSDIRGCSQMVA